jgi:hypothetical protein
VANHVGTGGRLRTGQTLLERRYRRLMLAYPRDFRSRRGDELLGMLVDAAPPGRTRPTAADAADLLWAGLRQRLVPGQVDGLDAGTGAAMRSLSRPALGVLVTAHDTTGTALFHQRVDPPVYVPRTDG